MGRANQKVKREGIPKQAQWIQVRPSTTLRSFDFTSLKHRRCGGTCLSQNGLSLAIDLYTYLNNFYNVTLKLIGLPRLTTDACTRVGTMFMMAGSKCRVIRTNTARTADGGPASPGHTHLCFCRWRLSAGQLNQPSVY